jgi:hypothetical protein
MSVREWMPMRNLLQLLLLPISMALRSWRTRCPCGWQAPLADRPAPLQPRETVERQIELPPPRSTPAIACRNRVTGHRAVSVTAVHPEEIPT